MYKILSINLTDKTFKYDKLEYNDIFLGGRQTISILLNNTTNIKPEKKNDLLIFAPGLFAGTFLPCGERLSIGGISPLTGTIKETNAGGNISKNIASLGLSAIVITGTFDKNKSAITIEITPAGVNFHENIISENLGIYNTFNEITKHWHKNMPAICIGPKEIAKNPTASIAITAYDMKPRYAGRGGLGNIMADKNIKAIIFSNNDKIKLKRIADRKQLNNIAKIFFNLIKENPVTKKFNKYGTLSIISLINLENALPTKNFREGYFDKIENISENKLYEILTTRKNARVGHLCIKNCPIACSNIYTDENGNEIVSGLEYETVALFGANCMIDNIDTIARINRLCNDLCIDTIEIACAIACAMDAGKIQWGDGQTVLNLLENKKPSELFNLILKGCYATGKALNIERIPHVKKQSLAAYDPRVFKGTGVTYATSPMGADHTSGIVLPFGKKFDYNFFSPEKQIKLSLKAQKKIAVIDSLGLCLFAHNILSTNQYYEDYIKICIESITGQRIYSSIEEIGHKIRENEIAFNNFCGINKTNDILPDFFYTEKMPVVESTFNIKNFEIEE